jgi:hypothetical protein
MYRSTSFIDIQKPNRSTGVSPGVNRPWDARGSKFEAASLTPGTAGDSFRWAAGLAKLAVVRRRECRAPFYSPNLPAIPCMAEMQKAM